jgi:2-amino-4-hydroxy-6-hydroxymethyldihydropteridine diphosphokinase
MARLATAYIALGANLGDAATALTEALKAIDGLPMTQVCKTSSVYKSAALDAASGTEVAAPGPDYLNAVIAVQTGLAAPELLKHLQRIEHAAGRKRPYPNAPRTLDLDLLLYGSASIDSPALTVPHPRMWQRAFVLLPLREVAPALVTPEQLQAVSHQTIERVGAFGG